MFDINNQTMIEPLLYAICFATVVLAQKDPNFFKGRNTIVFLFEWKWNEIAEECENFLQYKGYGGVQISPPNENLVVKSRPWWERYQPVSYKFITRSGNEEELKNMIRRCNNVGIRIYVDAIINHMAANAGTIGTAQSQCNPYLKYFPEVPYNSKHFNPTCPIMNYYNSTNVRNCELDRLADLDLTQNYVRQKLIKFLNRLIDLGVAGFRIDAAKHMWPNDLQYIFSQLKNLNEDHGFAKNSRPFIYQEVTDYLYREAISYREYLSFGSVLEFVHCYLISLIFRSGKLSNVVKFDENTNWNIVNSSDAVVFIDNHDNQRSDPNILTYKNGKLYKMAIAFILSYPYGTSTIMSSFDFNDIHHGRPENSPNSNFGDYCETGWVCEHRWRQISNMVEFRNVVDGTGVMNWWCENENQIAFSRGNQGFIVFSLHKDLNQELKTSLPPGEYCDIISGNLSTKGKCTGKTVTVDENGMALIVLKNEENDGMIAIHVNARL